MSHRHTKTAYVASFVDATEARLLVFLLLSFQSLLVVTSFKIGYFNPSLHWRHARLDVPHSDGT
jgi:hypothetical protein